MITEFANRVKAQDIKVEFTDELVKRISKVGFDDVNGARPLRRAIQRNIEDKFAEALLDKVIETKDSVVIDYIDGKVEVKKK